MKHQQEVDPRGREDEEPQGDYITDAPVISHKVVTDHRSQAMKADAVHDQINQFIEWPIIRADGAYQPIQYRTTGHMLSSGIEPENLKSANLVLTAMLSARLGYPLSAMLESDDPRGAVHLLDRCLKMVPNDAVIEFRQIKPDHIYIKGGELLDGKCLISPEIDGFNKVFRDLELILTRGHAVQQELVKGKYDVGLSEYRSTMQVSVIGVSCGKSAKGLNHPSILKVPIISNGLPMAPIGPEVIEQYGLIQSPPFKIRKSFQRLKPRLVDIPFEGQLRRELGECGCSHFNEKMGILRNVISICAIINTPPPVQMAELGAMMYGTDEQEVSRWLIDAGRTQASESLTEDPIVATKVDYYLARLLLDGILIDGDTRFTDRQKKVFETVKAINMGKVSAAILNKGSDVETLATISRLSGCWAPRERVFEEINKAHYEFSLSSVNNDLIELFDMGVLERAKPPKSRFFGYYVITTSLSDAIKLPAPNTIQDPVYEGKTVTVVNPLDGQVEKI